MVRRVDERCPSWFGLRRGIAVLVRPLDRRDRTPEVEGLFASEHAIRVGAGDVHEREIASRLRLVEVELERELTEHAVQITKAAARQNLVMLVCSSVRVALFSAPISFTSFTSRA